MGMAKCNTNGRELSYNRMERFRASFQSAVPIFSLCLAIGAQRIDGRKIARIAWRPESDKEIRAVSFAH